MNNCTSFCLLPTALRRKGSSLWVEGPYGAVIIRSLSDPAITYHGTKLKNGSVCTYLRHIVCELGRMRALSLSWRWQDGSVRITDTDAFYRQTFQPWTRERDMLERWIIDDYYFPQQTNPNPLGLASFEYSANEYSRRAK